MTSTPSRALETAGLVSVCFLSRMHGAHQVAQKSMMMGLPASRAARNVSANSFGAFSGSGAAYGLLAPVEARSLTATCSAPYSSPSMTLASFFGSVFFES